MTLADRMKGYERSNTQTLPPVLPYIVRIDGKAFHTYTKKVGSCKPFDQTLRDRMNAAAMEVMENSMGAKLAYVQSDEITIVFVEDRYESQKWFGGKQRKIESVSASLATIGFNRETLWQNGCIQEWAAFDARAFAMPFHDVLNNLQWRMQDSIRNSVQMVARHYFSHKQCDNKSVIQLKEMIKYKSGKSWEEQTRIHFQRGNLVLPKAGVHNTPPLIQENRESWNELIFGDCVYLHKNDE